MSIEKINAMYDRQTATRFAQEDEYGAQMSILNKRLFNLTAYFTMEDWRTIRTPKYWAKLDGLQTDKSKKEYTLECVQYYLKNIKKPHK